MKYIKSKGGYFYKEYTNGKKKRISKEEFMKHNKKSKKKSLKKYKMKGGEPPKLEYINNTQNIYYPIYSVEDFLKAIYTKEKLTTYKQNFNNLENDITLDKNEPLRTYIMNVNEELVQNHLKNSSDIEQFMYHKAYLREPINIKIKHIFYEIEKKTNQPTNQNQTNTKNRK